LWYCKCFFASLCLLPLRRVKTSTGAFKFSALLSDLARFQLLGLAKIMEECTEVGVRGAFKGKKPRSSQTSGRKLPLHNLSVRRWSIAPPRTLREKCRREETPTRVYPRSINERRRKGTKKITIERQKKSSERTIQVTLKILRIFDCFGETFRFAI
jgi:hypothetical protein